MSQFLFKMCYAPRKRTIDYITIVAVFIKLLFIITSLWQIHQFFLSHRKNRGEWDLILRLPDGELILSSGSCNSHLCMLLIWSSTVYKSGLGNATSQVPCVVFHAVIFKEQGKYGCYCNSIPNQNVTHYFNAIKS